jgi:pimeloyl-ACP methyl ester carboxylesterase
VRVATSHLQQRVVLVGHSGAGLLLPVIADALAVEVAGLVFVDSRLPPPGGRLLLGAPEFMEQLRAMATDGLLPTWSRWFGADMMRELVPDEGLRAELEMPRLPLSYFEAAVPLPDAWGKRCPCAYLLLSATPYRKSAAEARAYRWPVIDIDGVQHLAIATNPTRVTDALLDLERSLSNQPGRAAAPSDARRAKGTRRSGRSCAPRECSVASASTSPGRRERAVRLNDDANANARPSPPGELEPVCVSHAPSDRVGPAHERLHRNP